MFTNHQNRVPFASLLVVGLLSGCGQDTPPEPETSFPDKPNVFLAVQVAPGVAPPGCVAACCGVPDEVVVVDVAVDNWLLAPHDECGDEPQCGPVVIRTQADAKEVLEVETTEPTFTIDVLELAGSVEPSPENWTIVAQAVPRPAFDFPDALDASGFTTLDEAAQREREAGLCSQQDGRFYIHADIAPTTAPGTYVMRADLDDVEVACTFEVSTGEDGEAEIGIPRDDACAPAGLVAFASTEIVDSPDGSNPRRRAKITPREPVERVSLEVSRGGEILVTDSFEPAGELTFPLGEECSFVPCQIAAAWGLTL